MDNYIALVKKLSESNSSEIISNSSADHASVLISEMFRKGSGNAYIFSGSLNPVIYGREDVAGAIGTYLAEGRGNLKIVIQNRADAVSDECLNGNSQTGLVYLVKNRFGKEALSKIEIRRGATKQEDLPCHFAVVGKGAFRFEPDKTKHEAFASFNRPEMAERLVDVFKDFWDGSTVVSITN